MKGTHWTLFGYEANTDLVAPRPGLHIHVFGQGGDVADDRGHFQAGYSLAPEQWVLVRPDGYIAAMVASGDLEAMETYCF